MHKPSIFRILPIFIALSLPCTYAMAHAPVAYNLSFPIPTLLEQKTPAKMQHIAAYGEWSILAGQHYASLLWQQPHSSLKLFITPSANMITIDVMVKKKENRAFKLPFITWNIKNVSVTLNKVSDQKGWVEFSTAVYTQNIEKLVNALQDESPMTLNLSALSSITMNTQGLRAAMNDFTQTIRQNHLIAPKPLALDTINPNTFTPLDGMSPNLFPLYQETNYYIRKCIDMAASPAQEKTRYDICTKRNTLLKQMQTKGWCWGSSDPDQHDKDKNWRKCIMTPKGGIEKLKDHKKADFKTAKEVSNN